MVIIVGRKLIIAWIKMKMRVICAIDIDDIASDAI